MTIAPSNTRKVGDRKVAAAQPVRHIGRHLVEGIAGVAVIIGLWAAGASLASSPLFPGPVAVFDAAIQLFRDGDLIDDAVISLKRIAIGYVLGVTFGTLIGMVFGVAAITYKLFMPLINFLRMIPPVALVPVAIIWFGIGENSKYFIVMYTVTTALIISTVDGIHRVPRTRVLAARCLGASRFGVVFRVVLPSTIPYIWTGMRIGTGFAVASVVAAELIAASTGIGQLIIVAGNLIEINKMFVGLAALAIMGLVFDRLIALIGNRFLSRYIQYAKS